MSDAAAAAPQDLDPTCPLWVIVVRSAALPTLSACPLRSESGQARIHSICLLRAECRHTRAVGRCALELERSPQRL